MQCNENDKLHSDIKATVYKRAHCYNDNHHCALPYHKDIQFRVRQI